MANKTRKTAPKPTKKTRKTAPKLTKKQMERKRGGELISWNRPRSNK